MKSYKVIREEILIKTYKHLYTKLLSDDNISESIHNAWKNKHHRTQLMEYLNAYRFEKTVIELVKKWIINFKNAHHVPIKIKDPSSGKIREIYKPTVREQVVHHCLINVLKPIIMKRFYRYSYGSIPNRGTFQAAAVIKKWIKEDPDNCKYCMKIDHKHYFASIPQHKLVEKLKRLISDVDFLRPLLLIIMVIPGGYGLPIGFYTSQWLGMFYLQDTDTYIKQILKPAHYIRLMDDLVAFDSNKDHLNKIMIKIRVFTKVNQGCSIKNNYQVFRFHYYNDLGESRGRYLDFMGFRFYSDKTLLRKRILLNITRKAKDIYKYGYSVKRCRSILSYNGYLKNTNSYNVYKTYIKPYVSLEYCKHVISVYDKQHIEERIH